MAPPGSDRPPRDCCADPGTLLFSIARHPRRQLEKLESLWAGRAATHSIEVHELRHE